MFVGQTTCSMTKAFFCQRSPQYSGMESLQSVVMVAVKAQVLFTFVVLSFFHFFFTYSVFVMQNIGAACVQPSETDRPFFLWHRYEKDYNSTSHISASTQLAKGVATIDLVARRNINSNNSR